jgi:hypothetical protein
MAEELRHKSSIQFLALERNLSDYQSLSAHSLFCRWNSPLTLHLLTYFTESPCPTVTDALDPSIAIQLSVSMSRTRRTIIFATTGTKTLRPRRR